MFYITPTELILVDKNNFHFNRSDDIRGELLYPAIICSRFARSIIATDVSDDFLTLSHVKKCSNREAARTNAGRRLEKYLAVQQ